MMYHAESFAKDGFETTIIGYKGTTPTPSLLTAPGIRFQYLSTPPKLPGKLFVLLAPVKVAVQVLSLLYALIVVGRPPEFILVQNPPSIPTLALVQLASWLRGSKLIIDWHNLGYSILALKLGRRHLLVRVAKWFERTFGRNAYAHLFVTNAMKERLVKDWDLQGLKIVLHDRPPARFHHASATEAHELFLRIPPFLPPLSSEFAPSIRPPRSTIRTVVSSEHTLSLGADVFSGSSTPVASFRPDRPALVISSTSWTEDEDFGILINALKLYETEARKRATAKPGTKASLPKLLMVVTGKGPLRDSYMQKVLDMEHSEKWEWVRCRSLWVEAADYPLLLGASDLGVSLHSSSSALDLPMKVVDMFGCGLPVCALDFACLDELVQDGQNGLVFKSADQLANQLKDLLSGFPAEATKLDHLRSHFIVSEGFRTSVRTWLSWEENWNDVESEIRSVLQSVGPQVLEYLLPTMPSTHDPGL
ncbi:mannosyltransferase [Tulasnella sp. 425]|nr:mannosyltransferase [Tulasnella sp. 425]